MPFAGPLPAGLARQLLFTCSVARRLASSRATPRFCLCNTHTEETRPEPCPSGSGRLPVYEALCMKHPLSNVPHRLPNSPAYRMNSYELVEVAGLLAAHSQSLTHDQPHLPEQALTDYWIASRCRFDSWGHDLRIYRLVAQKSGTTLFTKRPFRLAVEIEMSEVLARTIAALGLAHDNVHGCHATAPITTNVLVCHREAASRLESLVAGRDEASFRKVAQFRQLRKQLHELTNQLVGCFLPMAPVAPYAHNVQQATQFGEQAARRIARGGEAADWATLSSTLTNLRKECGTAGPNAEQNQQIAAAAMGLFAPEMFDSYGLLRSTWLRRLERVEGETTVLVEEWLAAGVTAPLANTPHVPTNRLAGATFGFGTRK